MGLFSTSVSDEMWVGPASGIYEAARIPILALMQTWSLGATEDSTAATVGALSTLPDLEQRVSGMSEPTSSRAKDAHKGLKDAIKKVH